MLFVLSAKCFFKLRQLRRIRRSLDDDSVATLVHAFFASRVDYCSSLLIGAPKKTTDKLQRVLNSAARIVSNTRKFDRGGLTHFRRSQLHWLDVVDRVRFRVASRCSDVCTRWLLNTCRPTANRSPAFLVVATCDRLTVVISTSHVWNLLRTEGVHLFTPALQTGTHFLLTLETIVFLFHLLGATSKPFSSLSTIC